MSNKPVPHTPPELVSRYHDQRALCRPAGCLGEPQCWVELGRAGTVRTTNSECRHCRHSPKPLPLSLKLTPLSLVMDNG